MEPTSRSAWHDALIATLLACTLAAAWAWRDWSNLSVLRLPDADDMMRLQQIRDWLGGQAFGDLTQYRLGPGGTVMHWSRLDDLMPAAIVRLLEGIVGRHVAELAAVIMWPAMLLAAAIALTAQISRRLGGDDSVMPAMIVAAIAYPASTLFAPGRIDHHNLQMVLVLVMALVLVAPASWRAGVAGGISAALSLVVGMETAPLLATAATVLVVRWIADGSAEGRRLAGFGAALTGTTLVASWLFASNGWAVTACDGFTAITARAAMVAGLLPLALGMAPLARSRNRLIAAAIGGAIVLAIIATAWPQCLNPYGGIDPLLQELWLARVGEAVPLLLAPAAVAVGYAGLLLAGIVAGSWLAWRSRSGSWLALLSLQLASLAVALLQVRGAYAGALLAAPALGALIAAARRHGALALTGVWLASAGMLYPIAAQALLGSAAAAPKASCTSPELLAALRSEPMGVVMAPIDTGGPTVALTSHRVIAGAYHRDNAGNLAMYRFYLGRPEKARDVAARLRITHVVMCDGFTGKPAPDSLAGRLAAGIRMPWLQPVVITRDGAILYRTTGLR